MRGEGGASLELAVLRGEEVAEQVSAGEVTLVQLAAGDLREDRVRQVGGRAEVQDKVLDEDLGEPAGGRDKHREVTEEGRHAEREGPEGGLEELHLDGAKVLHEEREGPEHPEGREDPDVPEHARAPGRSGKLTGRTASRSGKQNKEGDGDEEKQREQRRGEDEEEGQEGEKPGGSWQRVLPAAEAHVREDEVRDGLVAEAHVRVDVVRGGLVEHVEGEEGDGEEAEEEEAGPATWASNGASEFST